MGGFCHFYPITLAAPAASTPPIAGSIRMAMSHKSRG